MAQVYIPITIGMAHIEAVVEVFTTISRTTAIITKVPNLIFSSIDIVDQPQHGLPPKATVMLSPDGNQAGLMDMSPSLEEDVLLETKVNRAISKGILEITSVRAKATVTGKGILLVSVARTQVKIVVEDNEQPLPSINSVSYVSIMQEVTEPIRSTT